jgi:hypothetical protein
MGQFIAACDRIRERFDCLVLVVHHTGIEGSRPRGSTALSGACDCQLAIKRNGNAMTMKVEYYKDGEEGTLFASDMQVVEVDVDEDGEAITSCVLHEGTQEQTTYVADEPKLTPNQATVFNLLREGGASGLDEDEFKQSILGVGIGKDRPATFYDITLALKKKNLIHTYAGRWYATN